jgi:hypothetical protein
MQITPAFRQAAAAIVIDYVCLSSDADRRKIRGFAFTSEVYVRVFVSQYCNPRRRRSKPRDTALADFVLNVTVNALVLIL